MSEQRPKNTYFFIEKRQVSGITSGLCNPQRLTDSVIAAIAESILEYHRIQHHQTVQQDQNEGENYPDDESRIVYRVYQ
ncbi:MAG: hypothetical protein D6675_05035 [Gemmatimonadetes bacterium]|nr:MAG: hypothetical protein D6675_05035 [Gemmatimonadota bacterium]